jgi:hypothetical protein
VFGCWQILRLPWQEAVAHHVRVQYRNVALEIIVAPQMGLDVQPRKVVVPLNDYAAKVPAI